jgi:hypothetical protein
VQVEQHSLHDKAVQFRPPPALFNINRRKQMKYRGLSSYLIFQTAMFAILVGLATGNSYLGWATISFLFVADAVLDRFKE